MIRGRTSRRGSARSCSSTNRRSVHPPPPPPPPTPGLIVAVVLAVGGTVLATATQNDGGRPALPARPPGPCDIYAAAGAPCVAAHSTTRALYAAYSGPLY